MSGNETENGIRALEQHLAEDPTSVRFVELAELFVSEGRYTDALQICETGLGYNPSLSSGHMIYAKALIYLGKLEEGLQAIERACALRTADPGIHCDAGQFLAERGLHDLALPYLQNGLRMNPDDERVIELKRFLSEELGMDIERSETGRWQKDQIFSEFDDDFSVPTDRVHRSDESSELDDQDEYNSLDDDDDDEPPTLFVTNPLVEARKKEEAARNANSDPEMAEEAEREEQDTRFDPGAGLRAEVSNAVNVLAGQRDSEPPTRFDPAAGDSGARAGEPVVGGRAEPPTVFNDDDPDFGQAPWDGASAVDVPAQAAEQSSPSKPKYDPTRVSASRPKGPVFTGRAASPPPATSISYLKVFMIVVPFLVAAIAGGLYFGFQHLQNEKIATLLDQAQGAIAQDTFAGYGEARNTLLKLLTMEEDHPQALAALAMVSSRIHAEFGPNLKFRDRAVEILQSLAMDEDNQVNLLWAKYQTAGVDQLPKLTEVVNRLLTEKPKDHQLLALAGELALRTGQEEMALELLKACLNESPSDPRTLVALANLEIRKGQNEQASSHLIRALTINGIHVRAILALAGLRLKEGQNLDRAKEDLEKALRLPQVMGQHRAQAYLYLAHLGFLDGKRSRALNAVKAGSELMVEEIDYRRQLAQLCRKYYELDEAVIHARKVLELDPNDMNTRLLLIGTDLPRGRNALALKALNKLVGKKVPASKFLRLRGEALLASGRYQNAIADLRGIPDSSPLRPEAWALEVIALLGMNDVERAKRQAQDLQRKHPDVPLAHLAMGQYRRAKGLRRGAAAAFRKAVQIDPGVYQAHHELAKISFEAGLLDGAEKELRDALAANPYHVQSYQLLGQTKLRQGDAEAALQAFLRQLKEIPNSPDGLVGMAEALLDQAQVEKALAAIRKARKAGAADVRARYAEGRANMANGKLHSAVRALSAADELEPRRPDILADLGLALLGIRSLSRAEDAFKESLKRSSRRKRLPRAQEGLARVLKAKRKWSDAAKAYERAAQYSSKQGKAQSEVTRLYMLAGQTMLRDTKQKDRRYARARRYFRFAARSAPQNPEPLFEIAAAFDREDKIRSARNAYQKVLDLDKEHGMALYRLGLLEFDEGKDQRAKELLSRFIKTKPKRKLAKRAAKILARIK